MEWRVGELGEVVSPSRGFTFDAAHQILLRLLTTPPTYYSTYLLLHLLTTPPTYYSTYSTSFFSNNRQRIPPFLKCAARDADAVRRAKLAPDVAPCGAAFQQRLVELQQLPPFLQRLVGK